MVIATYNWSAALALSLRSVLAQSWPDFEVIVVGDGCTDDSEAVVRGCGDPRVTWFNFPDNIGSQWRGNNYGIDRACGEYVAYLGHDDLWHPDHLRVAADIIAERRPAAVAAGTVLYGPPASGVRAVSGFFAGRRFSPTQVIVPSGLVHRHDLVPAVGKWRDHRTLRQPVDVEFVSRLAERGGEIAATRRFTVFKWPSAWRRNSYRTKDVTEQALAFAALTRDATSRDAFVAEALDAVLQAAVDRRFFPTEVPPEGFPAAPGELADGLLRARGLKARKPPIRVSTLAEPLRMLPPFSMQAFEWHAPEQSPAGIFAWSGPSSESVFELPVFVDSPVDFVIGGTGTLVAGAWDAITLSINGRVVPVRRDVQGATLLISCRITPADQEEADRQIGVTMTVPTVAQASECGFVHDKRWLGAAVRFAELRPVAGAACDHEQPAPAS